MSISINRKIEKLLGELNINSSLLKFKGGSTDSSVWRHCDKIIKIWNQPNFNLQILARTLANIHKFLSCAHLVSKLDSLSFATDNHLIGIFEYLEPCCEERYDPEAVGMTLAKVHLALETVPIGGTLSWVGFYGEYEEFKFLTPYVTDNSIKEAANFLLPYYKSRTHTDFIHYLHILEHAYNSFSSLEELTSTFKPDYIRAHNPVDSYLGYLEFINKKNITFIYDQMDYWQAFAVQPWGDKYVEAQYIRSATHITSISRYLINLLPEEKPKLLLENAVSNKFIQRIDDSQYENVINNHNSKNILYMGAIWPSWFDWDLSMYLVRKFPEYNFTFIGAVASTIDENDGIDTVKLSEELASHPNVIMLPEMLHAELVKWLVKSDVGLLPFKVNELTLACSPLKIFEYLAAGLPVVSPNLPQITSCPQVYTGNNFDEIAQSLAKAHKKNLVEKDKDDLAKFRQSNTWHQRLNALEHFIGSLG